MQNNSSEVTINIVELASDLASIELDQNWSDSIKIWADEDADTLTYTEEAQDIFNDLYDKYYTLIESTKIDSHESK
jgi:hypothetical protein